MVKLPECDFDAVACVELFNMLTVWEEIEVSEGTEIVSGVLIGGRIVGSGYSDEYSSEDLAAISAIEGRTVDATYFKVSTGNSDLDRGCGRHRGEE